MNWGMRRCIERDNLIHPNTNLNTFGYNLDGTGVDVVIQDTGICNYEFNDANGVSRIKQIDWYHGRAVVLGIIHD